MFGYIVTLGLDAKGYHCYKVKKVNVESENARQHVTNNYTNIYPDRQQAKSQADRLNG